MAANGLPDMVRRLRRLADPQAAGVSDAELLERYARSRDETAFELLLWRHGSMVHGVCRRLLRRAEDAEDAFQATFLTLVRKAATIRRGASLGAWLYQVAYRVALRARARATAADTPVAEPASAARCEEVDWRDLGSILDEEVRNLPARYRDTVILCFLEGRTHAEAARELRCPKGTVAIRLSRARKRLQARLTRRGITLGSGLPFVPPAPATLISRTLRLASDGSVSIRVTNLTEGAMRAMSLSRVKAAATVIVATAGLLAVGVTVSSRAEPPPGKPQADNSARAAEAGGRRAAFVRVPALRDGQLVLVGTDIAPGENVPADHRITIPVGFLILPVKEGESVKAEDEIRVTGNKRWRRWHEGEPLPPGEIALHRTTKECKRLEVGDEVRAGQLVGLVDTTLALGEVAIKIAALDAAYHTFRATKRTREEAERRVIAMEDSMRKVPGSVSKDDYDQARMTRDRYREHSILHEAGIGHVQQELIQVLNILKMHEIRTPVAGEIAAIEKERGDAVKAFDTVLQVSSAGDPAPAPAGAAAPGRERIVRGSRDGVLLAYGAEVSAPGNGKLAPGFSPLRVGDSVEAGAMVARLDDKLARQEVTLKEAQLRESEAALRASTKTREEAERRVTAMEASMRKVPGSVSKDDYEGAKLTASRYREEEDASRARVVVSEAVLVQAKTVLATYTIRSPVGGVVREFLKAPGEALRVGEPLIRLAVRTR
jgi:RNA polymerase sigma factor (sigma-70 family)